MGKFTIPEKVLYVCTGEKCGKRGGKNMYKLAKAYAKYNDDDKIDVIETQCTDRCKFAPVCAIQPGNIWLKEYKEKEVLKLMGLVG